MSTNPSPSRTADQFVVRLPDGMRGRIAAEAAVNGRSMNAEIVTRLQASLESAPHSPLPEIKISLETGDEPISWDEIHEVVSAIRKKMQINAVSLQITVITPDLASSSTREVETAELAAKLRAKPVAAREAELPKLPEIRRGIPKLNKKKA